MARRDSPLHLDVHGLHLAATGDWPAVLEALARDFEWFTADACEPDVVVEVFRRAPDPGRFGPLVATSVTERGAFYPTPGGSVSDLGRALVVTGPGPDVTVEGEHGWVTWKAAHDALLARAHSHLVQIGRPRVHGLGLAGREGGVLVLLPPGGGKTTLALHAIGDGDARLLSEGSPLLDASGLLHPFPLPLLVRANGRIRPELPPRHVRRLEGIDDDPATLELSGFSDRIQSTPVSLRHVVVGVRTLAATAALDRIPARAALSPFVRATVAGYGIRHGGARSTTATLADVSAALSRLRAATTTLRRVETWRLALGLDLDANWAALARLL